MTPFDFLSGLGSIASLFGLGMQIQGLSGSEDKNIITLRAFESITSVAFRWKHVHNRYHLLLTDVSDINEYCINTKKDDVSVAGMQKLIKKLKRIEQRGPTFRRDVDVYINDDIRQLVSQRSSIKNDVSKIRNIFGHQVGTKVEETYNAQIDVIKSHDATCEIIQKLVDIISAPLTPAKSLLLYNNIKPLYKSFHQVILHTDEILINTIDFYELAYEFNKK